MPHEVAVWLDCIPDERSTFQTWKLFHSLGTVTTRSMGRRLIWKHPRTHTHVSSHLLTESSFMHVALDSLLNYIHTYTDILYDLKNGCRTPYQRHVPPHGGNIRKDQVNKFKDTSFKSEYQIADVPAYAVLKNLKSSNHNPEEKANTANGQMMTWAIQQVVEGIYAPVFQNKLKTLVDQPACGMRCLRNVRYVSFEFGSTTVELELTWTRTCAKVTSQYTAPAWLLSVSLQHVHVAIHTSLSQLSKRLIEVHHFPSASVCVELKKHRALPHNGIRAMWAGPHPKKFVKPSSLRLI